MQNKKIKILYVHHAMGWGGAPINLLNIIKGLDADIFEAKVLFIKNSIATEVFKENGIECDILNGNDNWFAHNSSSKLQFWYFLKYIKIYLNWKKVAHHQAVNYLKTQEFDIIHLNSHVLTSWAYAAKKLNKKVVLHNQEAISKGYLGIRYKILKRLITQNSDAIINISNDNQQRLGIQDKSTVVYNFVTIPSSYTVPMQNSTSRKVLFLGGMAEIKGFGTTVACLPYLEENISIQFAGNIGKFDKPQNLKDRAKAIIKLTLYKNYIPLKKLFKAKNVEILGLLNEPLHYIDNCDILITPFKVEHFSRPAIEAFAYGKPVIGSNVIGMDEIINHNLNGLLIEKNNPKALAEAINYLCSHSEIAQKMGENGRKKAEQVFSPGINIKKVEDIYKNLMNIKKQ